MSELGEHGLWIKQQLEKLAMAVGDWQPEERLNLYIEDLLTADKEELARVFVEARQKIPYFPTLPDLLWLLKGQRWIEEAKDEEDRDLRVYIHETSTEEAPSMRKRR